VKYSHGTHNLIEANVEVSSIEKR